jgi:(2R)-3-sulfolactate dehydrogenase (NADP+)
MPGVVSLGSPDGLAWADRIRRSWGAGLEAAGLGPARCLGARPTVPKACACASMRSCGRAVRNSHHAGALGWHVERMAERGLVAVAFSNSPAGIAPWGGAKGVSGTNPIAFAAPRQGRPPLVIDASLSKVARGKIMLAAQKGEAIPGDWALDAEGRPTTDPKAALAGTLVPMGDAKGAALVVMVEILAAVMTGGQFGFEASSFFTAEGPPPRIGQLFLVLDPIHLAGPDFPARLEVLLGAILEQPGTRLPGDRRLGLRERARAGGLRWMQSSWPNSSAARGTRPPPTE